MAEEMKIEQYESFEEARDYILGIPKFTGKNSIQDTKAFYKYLLEPSSDCRIIHVAGTNGKGSVCSYINAILMHSGYHVGMFTSPHLVSICERMRMDTEQISEQEFARVFHRLQCFLIDYRKKCGNLYHPSFFEYLFFMSVLWYEDKKPDFLILETGLGGRLDATNIIDHKCVTAITRLGMDHMEYLGDTLLKIAAEKAGIMREKVPLIYIDTENEISDFLQEQGEKMQCELFPVVKEDISFCKIEDKSIDFLIYSRYYDYISISLHTIAGYQMENAALAVRIADALNAMEADENRVITKEAIISGLTSAKWEGRMEEVLPNVYLDGAHNVDGIKAFISTVRNYNAFNKNHLLFAVVKDKQYREMIQMLAESHLFTDYTITQIAGSRELPAEQIKELFDEYADKPIRYYDKVENAVDACISDLKEGERLFIAGSLYLVGSIKEYLRR